MVEIDCANCGARVESPEKYCPACGAPAPAVGSPDMRDIEISTLLAAANLSRIRRNYDDAEEKCRQALELAPESAAANALMGDIFAGRDNPENAAIYYQFSLDIDPNSQSVRTKLERAQAIANARKAIKTKTNPQKQKPSVQTPGKVDQFVKGEGYRTLVNIMLMVLAGLALMILAAGIIGRINDTRNTAPSVQPFSQQAPSGGLSAPSRETEQGQQSPVTTGTFQGSVQVQSTSSASSVSASVGETAPEAAFVGRLKAHPIIREENIDVLSAWADPRDQSLTIIFQAPRDAGGHSTRKAILEKAKLLAQAAYMNETQARNVTIRANSDLSLTGGNSNSSQIAFMGDISQQQSLQAIPENATTAQLESCFSNVFWHPDLTR